MAAHRISHWEIMGKDGKAVADFYDKVFDWAPQEWGEGSGYYGVDADHAGIGGAVGQGSDTMPNFIRVYVEVDTIDEHLKKITAAGGEVVYPRTVIPGVVAYAIFRDPAGNEIGITERERPD